MSDTSGGKDDPPSNQRPASKGVWGSTRPRGGSGREGQTYSSIASINTSVRDNKNILEVKLEKQEGSRFTLTQEETENLLRRLNILSSELLGASVCPEGRPVVLITLQSGIDLTRFLYRNESYTVKEGVRTTSIRPEGNREKLVKIIGLHPNTKDQAVLKYLRAHGKIVPHAKVIHHVFPGEPGSSLLAGKLNGNRSYLVELEKPLGSYHIIDGEKVSVRYSGQEWTCARCHQYKRDCPGAAVARECSADRVLLSNFMAEYWQKIGYVPDIENSNAVDDEADIEIQVGSKKTETNVLPENNENDLTSKYDAVIIKGFRADVPKDTVLDILSQHGLPSDHSENFLNKNENNGFITVENLDPKACLDIVTGMHRKWFLKRQIFVTSVVRSSPTKHLSEPGLVQPDPGPPPDADPAPLPSTNLGALFGTGQAAPSTSTSESSPLPSPGVQQKIDEIEKQNLKSSGLVVEPDVRMEKRKSEGSPEVAELSRKEKKMLREEEKKQNKLTKKLEFKEKNTLKLDIKKTY